MEQLDEAEVNFISQVHDMQMAADDPQRALFLRMQKEMSPALMRILMEARGEGDPSAAIVALAQYCACVIMASCSMVANGKRPGNFHHEHSRRALIITAFAAAEDFLQDYLKKDGLAPIKPGEIHQLVAEAHQESRTP